MFFMLYIHILLRKSKTFHDIYVKEFSLVSDKILNVLTFFIYHYYQPLKYEMRFF